MEFYDAHVHLQDRLLAPHLPSIFAQLPQLGVAGSAVNGTYEGDWAAVSEIAGGHPWIHPSYGLHPWWVGSRSTDWQFRLENQLPSNPSAGVGEIGLDRWILTGARADDRRLVGLPRAPLPEQVEILRIQLALAARDNRPTTLHCLRAWDELRAVLSSSPLPARGFLVHAYSGPPALVPWLLDHGAFFSFNGHHLDPRHVARLSFFRDLPSDRILVETDAPSMPLPANHARFVLPPAADGTVVNHPANLIASHQALAALRGLSAQELSNAIAANFLQLFGRAPVSP